MRLDRAQIGFGVCIGLSALAWGGLPSVLSKIETGAEGSGPGVLNFVALGVAVAVVIVADQAFRSFRVRRLEDRPTSRVRSLAAGAVELEGRAAEATLVSPLTGAPCVYWDYAVWKEAEQDELELVAFYSSAEWPVPLRDDTGTAWLDLRGAELSPLHHERIAIATARHRGARLGRLLELHRIADPRKVIVQERRIDSGDPLYARGGCRPEATASRAAERVDRVVGASRELLERERADPSIVEATALACAGRAEQRDRFDREIEARLGDLREERDGPPDATRLEALRADARAAAERRLIARYRRFARWFLAASERAGGAEALALAAHVERALEAPDQALVVGGTPETGAALALRCISERALLRKSRRFRRRLTAGAAATALAGLAIGYGSDGGRFALFAVAFCCVAAPFAGAVRFGLRTRWGREITRFHTPTEETRFDASV